MDLHEVGCVGVDWIELAQDRDSLSAFVTTVMNLGFHKCAEFIDWLRTV
jgi:hypothetical protein